ncbi:MAG: ATP-binding protein [Bacteroidetes bacterium]|nr:ATP-binding protein [Bacteroidota bacterium]
MIITRTIEAGIEKRIAQGGNNKKVIIIYGARQVGKTTLVKHILEKLKGRSEYFNCDYLQVQSLFSWENAGNLANVVKNKDLIVLDEAQRIRNIGVVLKILHDEFPSLQVIATGSSSFDLANQVNEPLTGRKIVYHLYPLTYQELAAEATFMDKTNIFRRAMRFGLYPSVILQDDHLGSENLNEITSSYLFKDILVFQQLRKPELLLDILKLLAFQISNEVSYSELAVKLRVDQTVIQRYLQLLEDNFIIFRLPALKKNLRNEIGKTRKIYFWDLGIRNALIQQMNSMENRNDQGALWENFCIAERLKFLHYHELHNVHTWFWRTYAQKEIDYIEEHDGLFHAYEIKWSQAKVAKPPDEFLNGYPGARFNLITKENVEAFICRY